MTKTQAAREILRLSSGTIACLIKNPFYNAINKAVYEWVTVIGNADDNAFEHCENWMQVLDIIR